MALNCAPISSCKQQEQNSTPKYSVMGCCANTKWSLAKLKLVLRDQSLIMGRGWGYKKGGEEHVKFNPYKKGEGKLFSHVKSEGMKYFEIVLT